jgi:hypothetical protein
VCRENLIQISDMMFRPRQVFCNASFSDNPVRADIATDIYRHPQTWGKPTTNFQKMLDKA